MRVPSGMTQGEVRRRREARARGVLQTSPMTTRGIGAAPIVTNGMRTAPARTPAIACSLCKLGVKKDCC